MFQKAMARLVPHLPTRLVQKVAARYIAGETDCEALRTARALTNRGFVVTLDILGEDTKTPAQAAAAADEYIALLDKLVDVSVSPNVSVKLTQLGLRLNEITAVEHLRRLLYRAQDHNGFVRIDMEDASLTDATLRIHQQMVASGFQTGTVLQARLRRTRTDAATLKNAEIRLCKGAYKEDDRIAYHRSREIRRSYMDIFYTLIENNCRVAAATHDLALIERIRAAIRRDNIPREKIEFQALLGVPVRRTLEALREDGFSVRLYVPFGAASLAYSLRRLNENPDLAFAIVKNLLNRNRFDAGRLQR